MFDQNAPNSFATPLETVGVGVVVVEIVFCNGLPIGITPPSMFQKTELVYVTCVCQKPWVLVGVNLSFWNVQVTSAPGVRFTVIPFVTGVIGYGIPPTVFTHVMLSSFQYWLGIVSVTV